MGNIPIAAFREMHRMLPLVCVDVVARFDDAVLLVRRAIEPLMGEWFFPGGRLYRGERIAQAAVRIVKVETGMEVADVQQVGVEETMFDSDPFGHGEGTHTVNVICSARITGGKLHVNREHSDGGIVRWTELPRKIELSDYVLRNIRRAFEYAEEIA